MPSRDDAPPRPSVSRRRVLESAVVLGGLAAAGSIVGVVRSRGYDVRPGRRLASLAPWELVVVEHVARRICAPDAPGVVTADDTDVAGFVDAYLARAPRRVRRDLGRFLMYVEQLAPATVLRASRFTRLSPADQDRVLEALESSASDLLRGGFEGLKALVFMGYYRDPRTWSILGYDGPLVGRPEGGWR